LPQRLPLLESIGRRSLGSPAPPRRGVAPNRHVNHLNAREAFAQVSCASRSYACRSFIARVQPAAPRRPAALAGRPEAPPACASRNSPARRDARHSPRIPAVRSSRELLAMHRQAGQQRWRWRRVLASTACEEAGPSGGLRARPASEQLERTHEAAGVGGAVRSQHRRRPTGPAAPAARGSAEGAVFSSSLVQRSRRPSEGGGRRFQVAEGGRSRGRCHDGRSGASVNQQAVILAWASCAYWPTLKVRVPAGRKIRRVPRARSALGRGHRRQVRGPRTPAAVGRHATGSSPSRSSQTVRGRPRFAVCRRRRPGKTAN